MAPVKVTIPSLTATPMPRLLLTDGGAFLIQLIWINNDGPPGIKMPTVTR